MSSNKEDSQRYLSAGTNQNQAYLGFIENDVNYRIENDDSSRVGLLLQYDQ